MKNRKVIFITGASSGIGKACAEHLANKGYTVYGTSRKLSSFTPISDFLTMMPMDVNSCDSVRRGIDYLFEREKRLDVVVNNAGFGIAGAIEETTIEEAKGQFETNFFGVLRVLRAVLPIMRQQGGGLIVNISSLAGLMGLPFQGLYSATKFALEGLSEALRMEVKKFKIKVVLIEPGDFQTQFTTNRQKTLESERNSSYQEEFLRALGVMEEDERNGLHPQEVAFLLERIIKDPKPKFRYTIGPFSEKLAVFLKKVIPSQLESILMKHYRLL
ncbi:MAG: SDR family oxidoreductase [candidate division WOR-3 bacterium]